MTSLRAALLMRLCVLVTLCLVGSIASDVGTPAAQAQGAVDVVINEFMASNSSTVVDVTGEFEDWVELRNVGAAGPVDIGGWTLRDEATTYMFPAGTEVADYLVLFASGDVSRTTATELHLPFKLSAAGEQLVLADPAGVASTPGWAAPQAYPAQPTDVSYGLTAAGSLGVFTAPTPGSANGAGLGGVVAPVEFSIDHGFYDVAQQVALSTATASSTIYYTVDGSTPSVSNGVAIQPGQVVHVSSTTTLRAVAARPSWLASSVETRTYLFVDDVITQSDTVAPPGWPATCSWNCVDGLGQSDQAMVYGMDSRVVDADPPAVQAALQAIPSISITTDLDNLFDESTGIYDNAVEARGASWQEVPASVELIDPSGAQPGFEINAGLRIRGGASRAPTNPRHSFRLLFRDDYGDGALDYALFGAEGDDRFEKVDLRTSQNFTWARTHAGYEWRAPYSTNVREVISRDTQRAMGQPYTRSRYYHLYLNGQYWGLYQTQERVSGEFGESYLGGDEDDFDVIKRGGLSPSQAAATGLSGHEAEASAGTLDDWLSMWSLVNDLSVTNAEFAVLADDIDLANLADYYLLHIFTGDLDGSPVAFSVSNRSNNWYSMRNRSRTGAAAKWIFFDHDSEHSLCSASTRVVNDPSDPSIKLPIESPRVDNTTPWDMAGGAYDAPQFLTPGWLHEALVTHPAYRQIFADRVNLHMLTAGGALTAPELEARLDTRVGEFEDAMLAEEARWGDGAYVGEVNPAYGVADWQTAVASLRTCFAARTPEVTAQLQADGLWPVGPAPRVTPGSGPVAYGTDASIATTAGDPIWFTTNGSDPRNADGSVSPAASPYVGPVAVTANMTLNARTFNGSLWSPLATADYMITSTGGPSQVVLNEYNAVSSSNYLGGGTVADSANGSDETFGRIAGNGGDWFELVTIEPGLDMGGYTIEVSDVSSGITGVSATIAIPNGAPFNNLFAGSIITVSEDIATDVSYRPSAGDWHVNIQAPSFAINNDDTQITIFDASGQMVGLPSGEGVAAASVNSREVFKFEGEPDTTTVPTNSLYSDGSMSTWGLPNVWDGGASQQTLAALRPMFGDVDCDGVLTVLDAVLVSRFTAGLIDGKPSCAERSPTEIFEPVADVDATTGINVLDAVTIARCVARLSEPLCPAP